MSAEDCLRWHFRVPIEQISYVRFVLESYEGLAQMSSSPGRCEIEWLVPPVLAADARRLSQALAEEVGLVSLDFDEDHDG